MKDGSIRAHARFFANQWSKDRLSKYSSLTGIWVDDSGSITGEDGWEDIFKAQVDAMQRPISDSAEGISFEEIWHEISEKGVTIAFK